MTYSIVARDPESGEMGVAVQSHWFSVGSIVTWAQAGVGAVATQAFAEVSYGPLGLERMGDGLPAPDALAALLPADDAAARRQVAMVDTHGRVGAHTGELCIADAGHVTGDGFSCQANMMLRDTVPAAMADAYSSGDGGLADRLLAALDAAEREGGDIRGRQSAALLVVSGERGAHAGAGRLTELRVEDHPEPLDELHRLLRVKCAYDRMNRGDELAAAGDIDAAASEYAVAQEADPGNVEFTFWAAVGAAQREDYEEARRLLARAVDTARSGSWAELLRRLPPTGLVSEEAVRHLLTTAP